MPLPGLVFRLTRQQHPPLGGFRADHPELSIEPLLLATGRGERCSAVLEAGQHAVVLGDGKLGLLVAQVLATTGAKVLAVGRHPEKLGILEARDIETRLASDFDPSSSQQPLADLVVDATGSSDSLTQAIAATRPRGTLALKTTVAEDHQVDLGPIVVNEIQLLGSRCGLFEPALEALNSHTVDTSQLIEATLPLSQAQKALERASRRGALKVLIECG